MQISDLKHLPVTNLIDLANESKVDNAGRMRKQDLIFAILNNKAKKTIVETGYTQHGMIEITTGLDVNEIVMNEGGRIVKDGQNVKIFNEDE